MWVVCRSPQMVQDSYTPQGPDIQDCVSLGAGAVILPGVSIGYGSFVAAGAVTTDVPAMSLAKGVLARISPLPDKLREPNIALNWKHLLPPDHQ